MPRRLVGLILALLGLPVLLGAIGGWTALRHSDDGVFTAALAPLHTDGYAIVVIDAAQLVARHGAGGWVDGGRIRVTVGPGQPALRLVLAPVDSTRRLLDGVTRAEVSTVGYAAGPQPVQLVDLTGPRLPGVLTPQGYFAAGSSIEWDLDTSVPVSVLVLREDGQPGIDAELTVGLRPGWLGLASWIGLLAGALALAGGLVLVLIRPTPTEYTEEFQQPSYVEPWAGPRHALTRGHDFTGELVTVPSWEYQPSGESPYVHTAT